MKVYYSHAMKLYGTKKEKEEIIIIKKRLPDVEIINPSEDSYQNDPKKITNGMAFWHRLIDECDVVCFSRLLEVVTSGVGDEVNYAFKKKKKVYEIKGGALSPLDSLVKCMTRKQTNRIYIMIDLDDSLKRKIGI